MNIIFNLLMIHFIFLFWRDLFSPFIQKVYVLQNNVIIILFFFTKFLIKKINNLCKNIIFYNLMIFFVYNIMSQMLNLILSSFKKWIQSIFLDKINFQSLFIKGHVFYFVYMFIWFLFNEFQILLMIILLNDCNF